MTAFHPGVPDSSEYKAAFAGYVAKGQTGSDPIEGLSRQLTEALTLLRGLEPARRLHRYAPGKWSIQQLLGHLTDTERVFAYRALRIARADQTPLPPFDENLFADAAEADACDWNRLVEEFEHVRRANILLFENLPRAAWTRMGTASGAPISVRALAYIMIGHVTHHLEILRERYLG